MAASIATPTARGEGSCTGAEERRDRLAELPVTGRRQVQVVGEVRQLEVGHREVADTGPLGLVREQRFHPGYAGSPARGRDGAEDDDVLRRDAVLVQAGEHTAYSGTDGVARTVGLVEAALEDDQIGPGARAAERRVDAVGVGAAGTRRGSA